VATGVRPDVYGTDASRVPGHDHLVGMPRTGEPGPFADLAYFALLLFAALRLFLHNNPPPLGTMAFGAIVGLVLWAEAYDPVIGGHHAEKLELLSALSLKTELEQHLPPGFGTVVDCTGNPKGLARAMELVRSRGRLILKSTSANSADLNLAPIVTNEINVIGSRCGRFAPAVEALASGKVDPRPLISAMYPLADALTALEAAGDPRNLKVLLRMD